jgi:hypothetical protein
VAERARLEPGQLRTFLKRNRGETLALVETLLLYDLDAPRDDKIDKRRVRKKPALKKPQLPFRFKSHAVKTEASLEA